MFQRGMHHPHPAVSLTILSMCLVCFDTQVVYSWTWIPEQGQLWVRTAKGQFTRLTLSLSLPLSSIIHTP